MSVYFIVAIFGVLALMFIFIGWKLLRQEAWLVQWLKGTSGLLFILVAVFFSLSAFELSQFQLVPDEENPSLIKASVLQKSKQNYKVALTSPDPTHKEYLLKGDLWQIVVRVWVWNPALDILQLPDLYKVGHISSRYLSIEQEIKEGATVEVLYKPLLNVWPLLELFSSLGVFQTENLELGFVPAAEGSLFSINLVDEALTLEAVNAPAKAALKNWQ